MHSLETISKLNVERTIKLALDRAESQGVTLSRNQVLDHLKFSEDEDVSQWEATVDKLLATHAAIHNQRDPLEGYSPDEIVVGPNGQTLAQAAA
jgi:hypothetical protein